MSPTGKSFRFVSCVRAQLYVRSERISKIMPIPFPFSLLASLFPFPFWPRHFFPFPLWDQVFPFPWDKWDQWNPSEIKWVQVINWIQVRSSDSKWAQVRTSESKWIQVRSSEIHWFQVSPSVIKIDQVSPSESKWDQSESKREQMSPIEFKRETPPLPPNPPIQL